MEVNVLIQMEESYATVLKDLSSVQPVCIVLIRDRNIVTRCTQKVRWFLSLNLNKFLLPIYHNKKLNFIKILF